MQGHVPRKTSLHRTSLTRQGTQRLNPAPTGTRSLRQLLRGLTENPDENFDGGRAFLSPCPVLQRTHCAHALMRLVPNQAPERSQFRFEVPARIASPGGRCRKGRCDCSPASRERYEGTLMSEPQTIAAGLKRALLRVRKGFCKPSTFAAAHPSGTHFTCTCGTFLRYQDAPPQSMARVYRGAEGRLC